MTPVHNLSTNPSRFPPNAVVPGETPVALHGDLLSCAKGLLESIVSRNRKPRSEPVDDVLAKLAACLCSIREADPLWAATAGGREIASLALRVGGSHGRDVARLVFRHGVSARRFLMWGFESPNATPGVALAVVDQWLSEFSELAAGVETEEWLKDACKACAVAGRCSWFHSTSQAYCDAFIKLADTFVECPDAVERCRRQAVLLNETSNEIAASGGPLEAAEVGVVSRWLRLREQRELADASPVSRLAPPFRRVA